MMLPGIPFESLGILLAGLLTLAVLSFVAGDNPVYRLVEHVFVGVTAGYAAVVAYHHVLVPKVVQPAMTASAENVLPLVPLLLGGLLVGHLSRRTSWLASIPLAVVIGVGAALALAGALAGTLVPQVIATAVPLGEDALGMPGGGANLVFALGRWTLVVGVVATLMSFSTGLGAAGSGTGAAGSGTGGSVGSGIGHGAALAIRQVGRGVLLTALGAVFASIAVSRFALLAGRVAFLTDEWLRTLGTMLAFG
ncbi:MAG: hypothetical protein HYY04_05800 [Chloroflexi bacterium]|nr:hypothetical protein [Chloroflexota bacterium]